MRALQIKFEVQATEPGLAFAALLRPLRQLVPSKISERLPTDTEKDKIIFDGSETLQGGPTAGWSVRTLRGWHRYCSHLSLLHTVKSLQCGCNQFQFLQALIPECCPECSLTRSSTRTSTHGIWTTAERIRGCHTGDNGLEELSLSCASHDANALLVGHSFPTHFFAPAGSPPTGQPPWMSCRNWE